MWTATPSTTRALVSCAGPVIETDSKVPVLIIDGEILVGLNQNRVLNTTILVPAKTKLRIPVSCVEAGRWRHTTSKASRADNALSPKIRAMKRRSVTLSARAFGTFVADQGAVWRGVADHLGDLGIRRRLPHRPLSRLGHFGWADRLPRRRGG